MNDDQADNFDALSDDQIDDLLSGRAAPVGQEDVAAVVGNLRRLNDLQVHVGPPLGEFIETTPAGPSFVQDIQLTPIPPMPALALVDRRKMLHRPLARMALAAGMTIAGITGAHAAGFIDAPLLPDGDNGGDVVVADTAEGEASNDLSGAQAPAAAPAAPAVDDQRTNPDSPVQFGTSDDGEISARIDVGDFSASIIVTAQDDGYSVDIDVEGVSEACEAALEGIDVLTNGVAADAAFEGAQAACESDAELLGPLFGNADGWSDFVDGFELELNLPDNLDDFSELFGEDFGDLPHFDPEQLSELFDGSLFDGDGFDFENFFDGFDFGFENFDLEGFDLENFNLGDFELPEGFNFEDFDLEGFTPEDFALPDGFKQEIEEFFEDFDPDDLEIPEGLKDSFERLFEDFASELDG